MLRKVQQYLISGPVKCEHFKIAYGALFGMACILFLWFCYFGISTILMPFQIEYREGAAQVMTQILLMDGNPFSMEYQPLAMNNYGIGYYLVVFPFAKLFGNTLSIHRLVSFCFLFATLLLIVKTIWDLKKDILAAFLAGLIIVVAISGLGGLGAFPSTMGTFLLLASLIIPFQYSFGVSSLVASAMFSIMAFYTKPYFILGFGIVTAYLFVFVSRRKALVYSLLFLLAFSLLSIVVRYLFDFYFVDIFISNISNIDLSPGHLQNQLSEMCLEFYPIILLAGLLLLLNLSASLSTPTLRKRVLWNINLSKWNMPLLRMPVNYFAFVFVTCFLIFTYGLGMHLGSYMTYVYQILLPPFVLWVLQGLKPQSRVSVIAFSLLLVNIVWIEYLLLNPMFLRQKESEGWDKLYHCMDNFKYVINSPVMASILLERGILPVDSGQTQYYFRIKPYTEHKLLAPGYETIERNGTGYLSDLQNDVKHHKFDGIFITQGAANLLSSELIDEYYVQVDLITVDMPQSRQIWNIEIWAPPDGPTDLD